MRSGAGACETPGICGAVDAAGAGSCANARTVKDIITAATKKADRDLLKIDFIVNTTTNFGYSLNSPEGGCPPAAANQNLRAAKKSCASYH
jgi:hypothetical protein